MTIPNTSMNTHRKSGDQAWVVWDGEQRQALARAVFKQGDIQARSNFRASPRFAPAIKCPECGNEHVRPCTRLDEYARVWTDNSCETCGHTLSLKEIGFMRSTERIMKSLVTLLALILVAGFSAATPKSQVACDKAGMNWDATATAPSAKCSSAFA